MSLFDMGPLGWVAIAAVAALCFYIVLGILNPIYTGPIERRKDRRRK